MRTVVSYVRELIHVSAKDNNTEIVLRRIASTYCRSADGRCSCHTIEPFGFLEFCSFLGQSAG